MQIKSWASLLLLAVAPLAAAQSSITLASGQTITARTTPTHTILTLQGSRGIAPQRLSLKRDETVASASPTPALKLVGEIPRSAVLLTDTYPSRPGGLSFCQAGEEQFLRVIDFTHKQPIEQYHVKLASCRANIELAQPGLNWDAATRTLTVHWLLSPDHPGQPESATILIPEEGSPIVNFAHP